MTPRPVSLDRARRLIDESGSLGVQAPVVAQARNATTLGSTSWRTAASKLSSRTATQQP